MCAALIYNILSSGSYVEIFLMWSREQILQETVFSVIQAKSIACTAFEFMYGVRLVVYALFRSSRAKWWAGSAILQPPSKHVIWNAYTTLFGHHGLYICSNLVPNLLVTNSQIISQQLNLTSESCRDVWLHPEIIWSTLGEINNPLSTLSHIHK